MQQILSVLIGALVFTAGLLPVGLAADALPNVPAEIKLPEPCELAHKSAASGFQVYTCTEKDGKFSWKVTPDADLADEKGGKEGRHYAAAKGPSWRLNDESNIVCEKIANAANGGACQVLLLKVLDNNNKGVLKDVSYVQRLETSGGVEPKELPSVANLGKVVLVPYTATYYFYAKKK